MPLPIHEGKQTGIDTSKWQFDIRYTPILDYQKVADYGVKFAICRAGLGEHYVDPRFEESVNGFRTVGIEVGAYWVFDPNVNVGVNDQLRKLWGVIKNMDIELIRGDFEMDWAGISNAVQLRDRVYKFLLGMMDISDNVGAYTAPWWWNGPIGNKVMAKDPPSANDPLIRARGWSLWNADYGVNNGEVPARMAIVPAGWRPGDPGTGDKDGWDIWQFTSRGHIPGIAGGVGNVDLNLMRDDLFEKVWGATEPEPPPVPPPTEPPPPSDVENRVADLERRMLNIKLWGESFRA